jgi:beta-1,4-mannosyl-glycoprotein beta-1,4-N-acetylglucosaminyltransferase
MELIVTEKAEKPTICLNMIVKNESHIIKETLEKLCNKIKFDYWVICDTGSTDETSKIILNFFTDKRISGELHNHEWKNFSHNRTLALEAAFCKTDLLLVFDADDEIVGDFQLPNEVKFDEYQLKFGSALGTSYTRCLLINNKKKFIYQSVIHEYIACTEPAIGTILQGDYYVISGRSGNRSKDPLKYLKDAQVLEAAHAEALEKKDDLYKRYAFYCANSYKDHGDYENAIKWYKITLGQENWVQEHYISCLNIYECYNKLNQTETGFFYLVKAFKYDTERVECLYPLLIHYCCEKQHKIAYNYYLNVKDFFENKYLITNIDNKLFTRIDNYNFFVPYYMILIADKVQDFVCVVRMFEIVFIKKMIIHDMWFISNLLFNLQFFICHVKPDNKANFIKLTNEYIRFLYDLKLPLETNDCLKDYETKFGLDVGYIFKTTIKEEIKMKFSKEECKTSKNILIYTGFMNFLWNDTYVSTKSIGGAEKAVAYLSRYFPKDYKIFIAGHVEDEVIDNITYVNFNKFQKLLENEKFHTIIVSRYVSFFEMFKTFSCYQLFLSAHDSTGFINGCNNDHVDTIIKKYDHLVDKVVTLTTWHKNNVINAHPYLKDKMCVINNGILPHIFPVCNIKIKNKFVWTSCSYRGLHIILNLWPHILEQIPNATLDISSYDTFPKNKDDENMLELILKYNSIKHHGKLNTTDLNNLISSAEYWLYTNTFPETSCITGLEMLMSEVICLYYPLAGLLDTVGEYGIQVKPGNEIETILSLTEDQKVSMRKRGKEYAMSCSWKNRAKEWCKVIFGGENYKNSDNDNDNASENINIESSEFDHLYDNDIYKVTNFNKEYTLKFKIYKNCFICNESIKLNKVWEPYIHELFEKYITPESVVIEGGAHIGTHTVTLATMAKKIYAFEPYPSSNNLLNININLNNLKNVTTFKKGLSKEVGSTHYDWDLQNNPGASGLADNPIGSPVWGAPPKNKINVELTTIDLLNLDRLDFIKLDIEGYEEFAIKGGINTILKFKPIILMECYKNHSGGVMSINELKEKYNLLIDNGYSIKQIHYADFLFENNNKNEEKIIFYVGKKFILDPLLDYFDSLKDKYQVTFTSDINVLNDVSDSLILFIVTYLDIDIKLFLNKNNNKLGFLNTEPLNLHFNLNQCIYLHNTYPQVKIYDYSKSNLHILNNNNITNVEHLPYFKNMVENTYLIKINNETEKIFDFGIIGNHGYKETTIDTLTPRRKKIVNYLLQNGFSVNIINGFKNIRDIELGKCKYILNIHGQINENVNPSKDECSNIFEHIRCDRLLDAGYNILSEDSYCLDPEYIEKYKQNLQIINYDDFFNLETYKRKNYCFIHSCTISDKETSRLDYIIDNLLETKCIDILENVFIINIGLPIENKYGDKFIITNYSNDPLLYENPTLNKIVDFSVNNKNCNILYLHSKGITRDKNNTKIKDWIDLMLYFLVEQNNKCIEYLNNYDTVGCNYHDGSHPNIPCHFSGNFWWAKTTYLAKCDKLNESLKNRSDPEFWLFKKNPTYYELYNSKIDHYHNNYPRYLYANIENKNKIIDCFTFYNELEMLTYRLNVLNDIVDYFILVEANQTHSGKPKSLFFNENKHLYEKFKDKIIHIIVDLPFNNETINVTNGDQWTNEKYQRNCISKGFEKIKITDTDLIIISDVDEIPDPNILKTFKSSPIDIGIKRFEQDFYYYNLESKLQVKWYHSKILSHKKYKELNTNCDDIRFVKCDTILQGGWHLSYFGNSNFIKNKLVNFAHQEYNFDEYTNTKNIQQKIDQCIDLFGRADVDMIKIDIKDNAYLPPLYDVYLRSFYKNNYIYYSQCEEDIFLNDHIFKNKKNGIYIELGALDGILYSNTKFFEDSLNWTGILIEPHRDNFKLLQKNRPNNLLFNDLVSCHTETLKFRYFTNLHGHSAVSGVENTLSKFHFETFFDHEWYKTLPQATTFIKPKTLSEIVKQTKFTHIDLLSLDVEGHEYEVLTSWDFSIPIDVILIETLGVNLEKDELCRQILIKNGYKFITKYKQNEIFTFKTYKI